ncbi:MAG: AAA family ATPase [Zetaproteobacteria bacterium]|nr:AAA family ATPase [Zetaproteobacteria bacterium]
MTIKKKVDPEEMGKELEQFIQSKFGKHIQVLANEFNFAGKRKEVEDEKEEAETVSPSSPDLANKLSFEMTPRQLKAHLDRYVIGQDEAKKAIAIAVCDHYAHVRAKVDQPAAEGYFANYSKQNILVLGPTGVGKTYMIKEIARLMGVPFVKADATRFSETGYMGANVDDLIRDLVQQADGDIALAECGIIYLDEADKLANRVSAQQKDVSGRGVQLGLLKLMEDTSVDLRAGNDPSSQMQAFLDMQQKGKLEKQVVQTKHILFIVSGAFTGLEKMVERRMHHATIGFDRGSLSSAQPSAHTANLLHHVRTEDLIQYGFEPEFVGRLPVKVACDPLSVDALFEILKKSEGSILHQYRYSFRMMGTELEMSDDALYEIAKMAEKEQVGARSLMTILEGIFRDFKFELPSLKVPKLEVDVHTVREPQQALQRLLKAYESVDPDLIAAIETFERSFFDQHGIKIILDADCRQRIVDRAAHKKEGVIQLCTELFETYEHGLKLVQLNTGKTTFYIPESLVDSPKETLEQIVMRSYRHSEES